MRKEYGILLAGLVGVMALAGCSSDNGLELSQTKFLRDVATANAEEGASSYVKEEIIDGKRYVSGWVSREVMNEKTGEKFTVYNFHKEFNIKGKKHYTESTHIVKNGLSDKSPSSEESYNVHPQTQMVKMGESDILLSISSQKKKPSRQNERED